MNEGLYTVDANVDDTRELRASEEGRVGRALGATALGAACGAALAPGLFVGQFFLVSALVRGFEWMTVRASRTGLTARNVDALAEFVGGKLMVDGIALGDVFGSLVIGLALAGAACGFLGAALILLIARRPAGRALGGGTLALALLAVVAHLGALFPELPGPHAWLLWPSLGLLLFGLTCTIGCAIGQHTSLLRPACRALEQGH